ncbi:MAG: Phospholipase [Candidatus Eremiobacteraeota bacterium]|nr:Phospholipase [Candidatus Eremiobacteraeota bacterium]
MLENRSFDHMLGFFPSGGKPFEGLTGEEANFADPLGQTGFKAQVTADAPYVPDIDPGPDHYVSNVQMQLFGHAGAWPGDPVAQHNNGFLYDYAQITHDFASAAKVMRCHGPDHLPALTALAQEFALCDHWFASVPGPTWPNRFFAHAATSGGHTDNVVRLYEMRTIYENLTDAGVSWHVYFHDFPQSVALAHQWPFVPLHYKLAEEFFEDCADGSLPSYSFIEPRYFNEGALRANDQHPIHGVAHGDALIADVYKALRGGPKWESTLLVVVTDEHGGLYDHVLPPPTVNPDGLVSPQFDFTRLGVRVPAVVASPWIAKGTISSTVYDHTTIPATLRDLFHLAASLTERDKHANTLLPLLTQGTPRTDTPPDLPRPAADVMLVAAAVQPDTRPLSRFQNSLITLAHSVAAAAPAMLPAPFATGAVATEREGAMFAKIAIGALRRL